MEGKTIIDDVKLCLQSERLKTFVHWPNDIDWFCTPEKLADAGFYCNPSDESPDNVCCVFCRKELDGWEPDDKPLTEHKKHSPKCPFLKLKKPFEDMTLEECCKLMNKTHVFLSDRAHNKFIEKFKTQADTVEDKIEQLFDERYGGPEK